MQQTIWAQYARYNRLANDALCAACAELSEEEYRRDLGAFFGSIHGTLNHLLLGDRIWMARFEGGTHPSTDLDAILFETFEGLRLERETMDRRIEAFFGTVDAGFLGRSLAYTNNQGRDYVETAPVAVGHFFNHQTHHRGQVHVMLSQTSVAPPSLDLHRIVNP